MKRDTKIDYSSKPDSFYATITLVGGEEFKIYAASDWYSVFHLSKKLLIPEDKIVKEVKGKNMYGLYIWNIDFVDEKGEIEISPKGKGVSLQLFAAIEKYMKDFYKKHDPQGIEFSGNAKETSRIKLYTHLAKKIEKSGYKYFKIGDYHTLIKKEYFVK